MLKKLFLIAIILVIIKFLPVNIPSTSKSSPSPSTSPHPVAQAQVKGTIDVKSVPEMAEILSDNQETRIKAGRKLVERVGVEDALEILEHSSLPHTGEGHLVVHQIGFYAYQKYGIESILKCKDYFLFACYHGAIIEAATDQGTQAITKMTDKCKDSPVRYFQCVHAAGHAIMAMFSYDLPQVLKTCDELYEKETNFPEALSSCHNGAFMENLFGVHDWGTGKTPKRDWLKDNDPYFPCNAFGEKYQRGCWLNQAARIYQMYQGDIPKTAKACENAGSPQYVDWCFDNIARQLHPLTNGDITKVEPLCSQLGDHWKEGCIIVNAGAYYSVGDRDAGIKICQQMTQPAQNVCFEKIMGQIIGDVLPLDQKLDYCNKLMEPYNTTCKQQLKLGLDKT